MRERDQRDDLTWVVIELTDAGERLAEEGGLEPHLRSVLDCPEDHPIFVPYTVIVRHKRRSVINVIEGYAFVATGLPDTTYFGLHNKSPNVKTVLSQNRSGVGRVLTPVPNKSVLDLQTRLRQMISREIEINSEVRVYDGLHRGLVGKVIDIYNDDAFILIKMRTIETIRVFPRYLLRPADGVLGFDSPSDVYPSYSDQEFDSLSMEEDDD